uniref:Myb/SANT-like DNA-binding domain-containing protein n=1 Tax=Anabas testudineus TaxID=64144 RepID=A0A3Q1IBE2_ANATE
DMSGPKMNRGQTWSREEVQCLIDIWSDDYIQAQLSTTHKNSYVYAQFSKRLREKGIERSAAQCRIKAKKLRQEYIKVRDALNKTGSSGKEKDKFPWFDDLDKILGTKPVIEPVDVVESHENLSVYL